MISRGLVLKALRRTGRRKIGHGTDHARSFSSSLRFTPAVNTTTNNVLDLRADATSTFNNTAGRVYTGPSSGDRTINFNVDRTATGALTNQVITLAGDMRIFGGTSSHSGILTTNVTGGNGYSLVLSGVVGLSTVGTYAFNTTDTNLTIGQIANGSSTVINGVALANSSVTVNIGGNGVTTIEGQNVSTTSRSQTLNIGTTGVPLAGNGAVVLTGSATGGNGYIYNLNSGKLIVNHANALGGSGSTSGRILNLAGGTLDATSGDIAVGNGTNKLAVNINGDFTFGGTNSLNLGTGATTLGTAAGTTRTITANGTTNALTLGGVIANGTTANSLKKAGTGTLILGGANTFDGLTTVSGGTLRIAAGERIANASDLVLDGGTFDTGGFTESMDLLALSNSSAIEFGAGTSIVNFTALGTFDTTKTLQLLGWSGLDTGSGTDQLFVGASAALSASELAAIQFVNPTNYLPGTYGATQLSSGEIVIVPEPASLGLLAMAGMGLLRRRRA